MVDRHPLRESLWELLITALYGSGRQADALAAYQRLRRILADELGIEPCPARRVLEHKVLLPGTGLARREASRAAPWHSVTDDIAVHDGLTLIQALGVGDCIIDLSEAPATGCQRVANAGERRRNRLAGPMRPAPRRTRPRPDRIDEGKPALTSPNA
jgi:Bacterial transcriptional activator domain